ncbi:MAG: hypothetical protein K2P80_13445 [Beijerinckiaceae bacterium]|nr:hypothetical protein [Beijerinckiaceae bacterium]
MVYVSITGLQLKKGIGNTVRFWWHAIRSMRQAQAAPGNLSAQARAINGIHHTLSVWTDEAAMRAYLVSGPHLKALRNFHAIATGKTVGYLADAPPPWSDVHGIWEERGKIVAEHAPRGPSKA